MPLAFSRYQRPRRGVSIYLVALLMPVIFGVLGLTIDLGMLYTRRAAAQRAADAAALAGAIRLIGPDGRVYRDLAIAGARDYATRNAYTNGIAGTTVDVIINPDNNSVVNDVRVVIARPEPVYFAPVAEGLLQFWGLRNAAAQFSRVVGAAATAEKEAVVPTDMSLGGPYGVADPNLSPANNSVFGPYANHSFGDRWSTMYRQDGTPNPLYEQSGGNFFYTMTITQDYLNKFASDGLVHLQIFDPDTNAAGNDDYDEVRRPNPKIPGAAGLPSQTITEYEILDGNGDRVAYYKVGSDPTVNNKWVTPDGFAFRPKPGAYRIRVKSIDGASENGYKLRAGPTAGLAMDDLTWNKTYGDNGDLDPGNIAVPIVANDKLQLNFTKSGSVNFRLGYLDNQVAGKEIYVEKFDVDVGSQYIDYGSQGIPRNPQGGGDDDDDDDDNGSNIGGNPSSMPYKFQGTLPQPSNNVDSRDYYRVPAGYNGGDWYAQYGAGKGDTSSWQIYQPGNNGMERVYLTD